MLDGTSLWELLDTDDEQAIHDAYLRWKQTDAAAWVIRHAESTWDWRKIQSPSVTDENLHDILTTYALSTVPKITPEGLYHLGVTHGWDVSQTPLNYSRDYPKFLYKKCSDQWTDEALIRYITSAGTFMWEDFLLFAWDRGLVTVENRDILFESLLRITTTPSVILEHIQSLTAGKPDSREFTVALAKHPNITEKIITTMFQKGQGVAPFVELMMQDKVQFTASQAEDWFSAVEDTWDHRFREDACRALAATGRALDPDAREDGMIRLLTSGNDLEQRGVICSVVNFIEFPRLEARVLELLPSWKGSSTINRLGDNPRTTPEIRHALAMLDIEPVSAEVARSPELDERTAAVLARSRHEIVRLEVADNESLGFLYRLSLASDMDAVQALCKKDQEAFLPYIEENYPDLAGFPIDMMCRAYARLRKADLAVKLPA